MGKRGVILLSILVIVGIGGLIGYKMWNKPFVDPLRGDAIKVTAPQLLSDFKSNEKDAVKKYVPEKLGNKVVEVSGEIKEAGKNESGETYYYLKTGDDMSGVKCIMEHGDSVNNASPGTLVVLRGFCDGVKKDSMMEIVLMDVIVNRCKPVK